MGAFFTNCQVRSEDANAVTAALAPLLKSRAYVIICILALMFCPRIQAGPSEPAATNGPELLATYGWMLAQEKNVAGIEISGPEKNLLLQGFLAGSRNQPAPFDLQKIFPAIEPLATARRQKLVEAVKNKNRTAAEVYFQDLRKKANLIHLDEGVECEILKAGDGPPPKTGATVSVHYLAHLIDGTEFYQMGPMDMILVTNRAVCRGWTAALQHIGSGGALKLYVPPPLSEKDAARFGVEPDSAMVFEVELLGISNTSTQDLADAMVSLPPELAPPAHSVFTDAQIIQTWGWELAQESRIVQLSLSQPEMDSLTNGLDAGIKGEPAAPERQKEFPLAEAFVNARREGYRAAMKQKHLLANAGFFGRLKQDPHVTTLPDGLAYEILQPGEAAPPKPSQSVRVLYTGRLMDGQVFDSTALGPLDIDLDKVMPGWSEGIQKIGRGGKIKLYIPPALGYGSQATSGIPPDSILIFEIELLEIKDWSGDAPPPGK